MYENIYSYNETIKGKSVWMIFKPNFREALTLFDGEGKMLSDGEIRKEGELVLDDMNSNNFPDVYVSENAQWFLEDRGYSLHLFVTERTEEITTPLGVEWNLEFNRILKKCKKCYWIQKKEEIRLYFYCAEIDKLQLCYGSEDDYYDMYKYSLKRLLVVDPYCAIDKRYDKPSKSCFILGRIRKTIGLKNSKLLDFIEPVHKIELDFEKEEWDFGVYRDILERQLLDLLRFCISKKDNPLEVMRIRAYFKNYEVEEETLILQFRDEIWKAFYKESTAELRSLNDVLKKQQDCTNVRFQLRLESEIECLPTKRFSVYFENGEVGYETADWIYENLKNCTDASGVYLGKVRNRYNFY